MMTTEQYVGQPIRSLQTMLRTIAHADETLVRLVPDGIYGPNTVQAGGAVVDLLNRADHNAGGRRYAGIGVHRMPPFFFLAPFGRGLPQGRMRGGFAADTR